MGRGSGFRSCENLSRRRWPDDNLIVDHGEPDFVATFDPAAVTELGMVIFPRLPTFRV